MSVPSRLLRMACSAATAVVIAGCSGTTAPVEEAAMPDFPAAAAHRIVYSGAADSGGALFGLDLDTGASVQLTASMEYAEFPVWSPDGGHIVFLGEGEAGAGLLALDAVTGMVELLMADLGEPVDFSPSGAALVFMADSESGGRGLVAHDIANATNTPFDTGSEADAYARWSKADNALVFESSRDGNPEIYRHEIDAGTTTRLTDNGELDEWPSPSPDGNWIAWASGSEEVKDLWIMRSDGTEKRQLSDGVLFGDAFAEWSPDGAEILLSARDDEGSALFLVNLASGEMRRVTAGSAAAWR